MLVERGTTRLLTIRAASLRGKSRRGHLGGERERERHGTLDEDLEGGASKGVPWQDPSLVTCGCGATRGSQCWEEPAEGLSRRCPAGPKWDPSPTPLPTTQVSPLHAHPSSPLPCLALDMPKIWPGGLCSATRGSYGPQRAAGPRQGGTPTCILQPAWRRPELSKWLF